MGAVSLANNDYAAGISDRYRYNAARLTPRYLAMSLPVCPSAFIRFAVALCSVSVPLARDVARFNAVRC
jgi:hypothetical protein